jgi:tRNA-2-methylthio-N6-dimethylallyladenosine synthase
VVPYTRGPEVHRAPQAICDEIKHLVAMGALEITLLGQTVNHYTYVDGGKRVDFADLLQFLHDAVPDLPRLRFITSYPRDFTDAALDVMAACPRICSYLHIPAQSGSNAVLRRMNRGYTIEQYLDLIDRARSRMPDIALAGDMITGFIGETDEDHQLSVEFLKKVRYKSCFIFKYSPREGTVAARRWQDDIPERIKQERHQELLDTQHEISLAHHQRYVGQILSILVERENPLKATPDEGAAAVAHEHLRLYTEKTPARLIGRTMRDEMVVTQGPVDWIGKIITVKATKATALTVFAEPMEG